MSYKKLEKKFTTADILGQIASILSWDTATMMPQGASPLRGNQLVYLTKQMRSIIFNNSVKNLLNNAKNTDHLSDWEAANLKMMQRVFDGYNAVPSKVEQKYILACNKAEMVWREARIQKNFKIFLPELSKVIATTKEIAKYRADYFSINDPYEALVDIYDPGRKLSEIDKIFAKLEQFLPSFIQTKQKKQEKQQQFTESFDIEKQKALGLEVMKIFGFDFQHGRIDTSTHPFCGGYAGDIRITTRYNNDNLFPSLYGVIHETGHALYEQNRPQNWITQPVSSALGMSIHESQSLLAENQIGLSKQFLEFIQPKIISLFNLDPKIFSVENIYDHLTYVEPSFIRVEADEVTYPLHIILRYKLEKLLISGDLAAKDLPEIWNTEFSKYLGIEVKNDADGCLQDIHWSGGGFGYFPSYTLGALTAAQIMNKIKSVLPNTDSDMASGNLQNIYSWLRKNIHSKGSFHSTADELLLNATGETLNPEYFITYLQSKYDR